MGARRRGRGGFEIGRACRATGWEPMEPRLVLSAAVPADFDGDARSDFALFRFDASRDAGAFRIETSSDSAPIEALFGGAADRPIAGDFDGDGITDVAVHGFSPDDGFSRFAIRPSDGGSPFLVGFGGFDDRPVAGDFDGDAVTDIAVFGFSPDEGFSRFAVRLSGGASETHPTGTIVLPFGGFDDRPIVGDFDGDGIDDFGVYGFSPDEGFSRFAIQLSGGPSDTHQSGVIAQPFGGLDDLPVIGDFDGDGRDDLGVYGFSPDEGFSRFAVLLSGGSSATHPAGVIAQPFGGLDDLPVAGDFDGDGVTDIAVFGFSPANGFHRFAVLASAGGGVMRPLGEAGSIALPTVPEGAPDGTPPPPSRPPFQIDWINRVEATAIGFTSAEVAVIDQAITIWEGLIVDNGRPDNRMTMRFVGGSNSSLDLGDSLGISGVSFDATSPFEATIQIDADAGGDGWFVDPTPADDLEFPTAATPTFKVDGPRSFDLLTTVVHEIGHALGIGIGTEARVGDQLQSHPSGGLLFQGPSGASAVFTPDLSHLDETIHAFDLMAASVGQGVRSLPTTLDLQLLADIWNYQVVLPRTPPDTVAPVAESAVRQIVGDGALEIAVTFNEAIDLTGALDPTRYALLQPDGAGGFVPVASPFESADFDTSRLRLRLRLRPGLIPALSWRVLIPGLGATALTDPAGNPLDGDRDGLPGGDALLPLDA